HYECVRLQRTAIGEHIHQLDSILWSIKGIRPGRWMLVVIAGVAHECSARQTRKCKWDLITATQVVILLLYIFHLVNCKNGLKNILMVTGVIGQHLIPHLLKLLE